MILSEKSATFRDDHAPGGVAVRIRQVAWPRAHLITLAVSWSSGKRRDRMFLRRLVIAPTGEMGKPEFARRGDWGSAMLRPTPATRSARLAGVHETSEVVRPDEPERSTRAILAERS